MDEFSKSILFSIVGIGYDKWIKSYENTQIYSKFSSEFNDVIARFQSIPASIFASNKFFSDFPKNTFLYELIYAILLKQEENKDFSTEEELNSIYNKITAIREKEIYSEEEIITSLLILLYIFLQENMYGPSFFFIKETEKIDFSSRLNLEFNNHLLFQIENKFPCSKYIDYLTMGGEKPYKKMKLSILFVITHFLIIKKDIFSSEKFPIIKVWKARLLFLNNKMLPDVVFSIRETGFKYFNEFLTHFDDKLNDIEKGLLYLEEATYCTRFYKYKENKELLEKVLALFNINLNLTGVKGKKTKYQQDSTVQLVLQNKNEELGKEELYTSTQDLNNLSNNDLNKDKDNKEKELYNPDIERSIHHQNLKIDDVLWDSHLLEKPLLQVEEQDFKDYKVCIYDQIYVAALLNEYKKSFADEELLREEIKAFTTKCLSTSFNWLVFSKLLIHRSLAEDKNSKTVERALLQIKSICDQHNDREPIPFERSIYLFSVDYPFIWANKRKYADMWMSFGSTMTAFDIYNELEIWDEAITCLFIAGKTQKAKDMAFEKIKHDPDPSILVALGELTKEEKYFIEALEVSNGKYTRAHRSLGNFYFGNNQLEKSLEHYEKALEINPLFPKIWFTVGCIYLRLTKFEKAANAFSQSIAIDEDNGKYFI
jgi:hypothetical protein